jgi:NTE family protein
MTKKASPRVAAPSSRQALRSRTSRAPPLVSLVLSGGQALGAYSSGAVQALEESGQRLDLLCGGSVGAIMAAIVAGSPEGQAVERLRAFWQVASSGIGGGWPGFAHGRARELTNAAHAMQTLLFGRPGIFRPRPSGFLSMLPGTPPDVALFDPGPIVDTLERLVDFSHLNAHGPRLIVCAADLERGELVCFDSRKERITLRHLLASTAFVPSFPPVEIDGRLLGDPGLICNLPLDPILQAADTADQLCFAVDLFSSTGPRPHPLDTGLERAQDIIFSAQTTRTLEAFQREQHLRHRLWQAQAEPAHSAPGQMDLVMATYRALPHEVSAKGLEFSGASLRERWEAGRSDMCAALAAHASGQATLRDLGFALYRPPPTGAMTGGMTGDGAGDAAGDRSVDGASEVTDEVTRDGATKRIDNAASASLASLP